MSEKYCCDCKYSCLSTLENPCCNCYETSERPYWKPEDAAEETPVTDDKNISMIKSIIDEAMEKRDRTVSKIETEMLVLTDTINKILDVVGQQSKNEFESRFEFNGEDL